jgi:type IV secretion system protein VirB10
MNLFKSRQPESELEDEEHVEGERELSTVNKGVSLQHKITNWIVIVGACALASLALYKYYSNMYEQHKQAKEQKRDVSRAAGTTALPPLMMPEPESEPAVPTSSPSATAALPPLQQAAKSSAIPSGAPVPKSQAQLLRERRLESNVRFNFEPGHGGTSGPSDAEPSMAAEAGTAAIAMRTGARAGSGMGGAGQPASYAALRAYRLPDATLMITRGKVIPCTLIPAVDTTLTGIVSCVTAEDTTGADNKVSLMERGTICTGQQAGGIAHGQRRVGIIWQRCETPQHVLVPLDAGGADSLGRPGIPGEVDNHFWDRFGAAIALSLISDVGSYLASQGGGNTTVVFPVVSGPQAIMSEVLKHNIDIAPTITAQQGARVLIYLAGDIDFRDVYQLERRH